MSEPTVTSQGIHLEPSPARPPGNPGSLPGPRAGTVLFGIALFLVVFSRWGSYLGVPGIPVFVSDVFVAAGLWQTGLALRRRRTSLAAVATLAQTVHLSLLLVASLLAWVLIRAVIGAGSILSDPLAGLRDLAPYAYAIVAIGSFVLVTLPSEALRRWIYAGLSVHLVWSLGAPLLPGWPRQWPTLGEAAIFTTRPDFDSAIFGIGVALALHDLLTRHRETAPRIRGWLLLLLAGNGYALAISPTRAGLLAGLATIGSVLWGVGVRRRQSSAVGTRPRTRIVAASVLAIIVLAIIATLTPSGQRLVEPFRGGQTGASGTLQAREYTWSGVSRYLLSDARRTAAGVGFGPDFITDSGTAFALEGTEYKDVRSPHNYLLGTWARLGVAGALLVLSIIVAAGSMALRTLRLEADTVSVLAALLVIGLPVTAVLGVVLESPFGAIPYFWAVGHLARNRWQESADERRRPDDAVTEPAVRALQPVTEADLRAPAQPLHP